MLSPFFREHFLIRKSGKEAVQFGKGVKFRSEINWGEIIKDKRFKGKTTPLFLSRKFADMMSGVKKANPDIEARDITIEDLRQYSDERAKIPYKDKHFSTLIEDYVNIKNSM